MKRSIDALKDGAFDLLILGGGITGAGVALDATMRGWRVALIDKGDFASGTSSVSSKLVHGGLRYLEHGDFRLVFEALQERRRLLKNAPHLVRPLPFTIPFFHGARVGPWRWRAGLWLYDLLAGRNNLQRSHSVSTQQVIAQGIHPAGLLGGASYFDAQMDDARLCLEVLRTAAHNGARVVNYAEAVAFERAGATIKNVRVVDRVGGKEITIHARQVLNATGPWVDTVAQLAGDTTGPWLEPTKGVHLIVRDLGLSTALLLLHPVDGRVLFVIPWPGPSGGAGAKTLIGTTDTLCDVAPEELRVSPNDVAYLLEAFNFFFMKPLSQADVLGSFVGLRPLVRAQSRDPAAISREFRIFESPSGLMTVAGGKFTTYRHMAAAITDRIERRLGRQHRCLTADLPLDGTPEEPWQEYHDREVTRLCQRHRLVKESAGHLVNRYGRRATEVAAYLDRWPRLVEPIVTGEPDLQVELIYQRDHEMAIHAADHLLRRTRLGLCHANVDVATTLERYARV
jgi:glycerol-3-phosphate dehydrogenase